VAPGALGPVLTRVADWSVGAGVASGSRAVCGDGPRASRASGDGGGREQAPATALIATPVARRIEMRGKNAQPTTTGRIALLMAERDPVVEIPDPDSNRYCAGSAQQRKPVE
jgi:hypothetical protein